MHKDIPVIYHSEIWTFKFFFIKKFLLKKVYCFLFFIEKIEIILGLITKYIIYNYLVIYLYNL